MITAYVDLEKQYNQTPYLGYPFVLTHPYNLYTIAKLTGLNPADYKNANVLELGCGEGWNIIPMAYNAPNSNFTGIDLSSKHIRSANIHIKNLKLNNIVISKQSIDDFNPKMGEFDYIIVHGVFSWVSESTRDQIFRILRKGLAKFGVGYISYNIYPGWNMVKSLRQLLQWHARGIDDHKQIIRITRQVITNYKSALEHQNTPYAKFMITEFSRLNNVSDSYLLHEYFADFNDPVYFEDFVRQAETHQLGYLAEADIKTFGGPQFIEAFNEMLNDSDDIIERNQCIDFINNNRFRSSLLCHKDISIDRTMSTAKLRFFYFRLIGNIHNPRINLQNYQNHDVIELSNQSAKMRLDQPNTKLLAVILFELRHTPLSFTQLLDKLLEHGQFHTEKQAIDCIMQEFVLPFAITSGIVEMTAEPQLFNQQLKTKAKACGLLQYQINQNLHFICNRAHEVIQLDQLDRFLLMHLDGSNDIDALIDLTITAVKAARLDIDGVTAKLLDQQVIKQNQVREIVENRLTKFSSLRVLEI